MAKPANLSEKLSAIASQYPESVRQDQGSHASFLVRKKVFAYFLNNHHNDGIISIACKVLPGDNKVLCDRDSKLFYLPAYIGPRGWVAMRLDQGKVDWEDVAELMLGSYTLTAPKTLVRQLKSR